ncbi:DNA ligase (ATP) [Sphingomonas antarctica]|uniref:cisplatin damage response ATP-dependent DNA ligase n=1 Tax=Sphingomonas antarctica TaxID=2040274 RepID=UPI0039EC56FF
MRAFADLIDRLIYTRGRNAKLALIGDYLRVTPDPDRGYALGVLTGELDIPAVKPALIRALIEERVDPVLYRMSRDYVGDSAETVALMWPSRFETSYVAPAKAGAAASGRALSIAAPASAGVTDLRLAAVVDRLLGLSRSDAPAVLADYLDRLESDERFALLKMATGALRVGVTARLAKVALAQAFGLDVEAVEEVWHGIAPPYTALFDWAEGRSEQPTAADTPVFRSFMLAHPMEDLRVSMADYAAEWKWDGIRVQIVNVPDKDGVSQTRLYSRTGDDVTGSFPDVAGAVTVPGVFDGELMVRGEFQGGEAASFNALQQRLGRKAVSKKMLDDYPAFVRLYDALFDGAEDLRPLPWTERRARLEAIMPRFDATRFDLSQLIEADSFEALEEIRAGARDAAIEGVMLKRRDSPYTAGRRTGLWYKWKRDALTADCVMMYAQRGNGRRSSFYSDYTFGCWGVDGDTGDAVLTPVGKAYSGITDEELKFLDKFVRNHTLARFGPVREVEKTMVLEVAFDSVHLSKRHKSGVAMRFPRIHRIRNDKPAAEADTLATLQRLVT